MQVTQIQTDHTLMEVNCRSTADYPIRFYLDIMREFDQKCIRWHWHPELEFNVVTRGTIQYYVEDQRYTLSAGQGIMKNSNVLHMAEPDQNSPDAEMVSVIMDTEFIAPAKSIIYQKYIEGIHGDVRLRCIPFTPEIPWQGDILRILQQARQVNQTKEGPYELHVHRLMCEVWQTLVAHFDQLPRPGLSPVALTAQVRLKQMIGFIQKSYTEKITLDQIAAAASISKTACMNCFRNVLGISPIDYVVSYRLECALHLLLATERSVAEIADTCGFGDTSYFGKQFRRKTGLSPVQYRNLQKSEMGRI